MSAGALFRVARRGAAAGAYSVTRSPCEAGELVENLESKFSSCFPLLSLSSCQDVAVAEVVGSQAGAWWRAPVLCGELAVGCPSAGFQQRAELRGKLRASRVVPMRSGERMRIEEKSSARVAARKRLRGSSYSAVSRRDAKLTALYRARSRNYGAVSREEDHDAVSREDYDAHSHTLHLFHNGPCLSTLMLLPPVCNI